ncbi:hypothetical protein Dimus_000659 [Dionaea muscipula]
MSKSASLSSQQEEEGMDAFWDTLPKVDNPPGPTTAELPPEVPQKEAVQENKGQLQEDMANLQRDLDAKVASESRVVQELNKVQYAPEKGEKTVTSQNKIINELRLENQKLKERLEYNKKRRRDMIGVLNEYDERLKVNTTKEFIHSTKFEDGLAKVIGPWFKNEFSFCTAQVKDLMQRAGQSLTILKGLNIGRKIGFLTEPFVSFPEDCLPSHTSSAKLSGPFMFLKDWTEKEEKKDKLESSRKGERGR